MLRKEILLPINDKPKFELQFIPPYSTFENGEPKPIPYVIDGLLPQGGVSTVAGKPKDGKSSFSRIESVSVASGAAS
jgi:AAA domain